MTEWAVVAVAPQVLLDPNNRAEMTFTVTNPGDAPDRAVFLVEPDEGVPRSWFTVAEPQRPVPPHGSVSYLVVLAVPPGTPPGSHALRGCVYSANTAPEESSRRSGRVTFEVRPAEPPKRPWWPYAVAAGLVLVVLAVGGWLVFRPRDTTPAASPAAASPTPSQSAGLANVTYEMENLLPPTELGGLQPGDVGVQTDCCGLAWSNGAQMFVAARTQGWTLVVAFTVPATGQYTFSTVRTTAPDYANTTFVIDTTQIGDTFSGYSPAAARTGWLTVGSIRLTAGRHVLTLAVVGRNKASSNYNAGVDAVRFTQTAA